MSAGTNTTFNANLYCLDPILFPAPNNTCPGLCRNQDVSGEAAYIAFLVSTVVSGISMIWLGHRSDRRLAYIVQYLNNLGRVTSGLYLLLTSRINRFDAYFTVYLVAGANINALVGSAAGLDIVEFPFAMSLPMITLVPTVYLLASANESTSGSQSACDFPAYWELLAPMIVFSAIVLLLVLSSGTLRFNRWFSRFVKRFDSAKQAQFMLKVFWTTVIVLVDAYWIFAVTLFQHLNAKHQQFLDTVRYAITQSQILAIVLSAVTVLPTARMLFREMRLWVYPEGKQTPGQSKRRYWDDTVQVVIKSGPGYAETEVASYGTVDLGAPDDEMRSVAPADDVRSIATTTMTI